MNRQIVAFLSLFSLVLVLSIYYVMLPFANPNTPKDSNVNVDIKDSAQLYFATLHEKKESQFTVFVKEKTEIVASSDATGEEKAQALAAIELKRAIADKEDLTVNLIKEYGFDEAYVEVVGSAIEIIVALDEDYSTLDIAQVMIIALNQFGKSYIPKVRVYEGLSNS